MEYSYKPTTHGLAVMAACMALGAPFNITRVAFGSGKVGEDVKLADVHELLSFVSDGTVADRSHKDDRFFLTIQYANSEHKDVPTFLLTEFMVFVEDPETGEETDLIYGNLRDYRLPVPVYHPAYPPSVFNFPLMLILSNEINVEVAAPAGLVTYDDLNEAVETAYKTFVDSMAIGGIKKIIAFTMAPDDWQEDAAATNGYGFYYDLIDADITKNMVPNVIIAESSLLAAALAGMCATATSYAGYVRLKCVERPESEISASCALLVKGALVTGEGAAIIDLPPASAVTCGGVIIEEGSGLKVDEDGRLSVDIATDEDMSDMMQEILG